MKHPNLSAKKCHNLEKKVIDDYGIFALVDNGMMKEKPSLINESRGETDRLKSDPHLFTYSQLHVFTFINRWRHLVNIHEISSEGGEGIETGFLCNHFQCKVCVQQQLSCKVES